MQTDYDIAIIGGGLVGAALACALGDSTLRIGVIESQPAAPMSPGKGEVERGRERISTAVDKYDVRVSAITLASRALFENIGVWKIMPAQHISPLREMHVWDAQGPGMIHFDAADLGEPELGYIIENRVLLAAMLERMAQFANVNFLCPAEVASLRREPGAVVIELQDGGERRAGLVVGADGAHSVIRKWTGIRNHGWSYDQRAIVATVTTALPHNATAWQVFLPTGPLAFLPLVGGASSIVWSCDSEHAAMLLELDDGRFIGELHAAFGDRLGAIESIGRRLDYPLALAHADLYIDERIVLIGDAAHRVHPLAGQGVNLGLLDAATLTQVVLDAVANKKDIGTRAVLRRYERWRKGDNLAMLAVTDVFKRGFGSQRRPLVALRNAGLNIVDRLGPLKTLLMRYAVGLEGDLPMLARSKQR